MQCWGKTGTGALLPRAKDIRAYRESKATPTATSHAECFTSFPSFSISLHTQEFAHLQLCHLLSGRSRGRSFHLGFHLIGCIWGRPGPIPQTPVPPKSTAPSLPIQDVHGKGPAAPWRPRARLQLQAGIPATTVQEEDLSAVSSFPHTVPCLEKKKGEAHRGLAPWHGLLGLAGLCAGLQLMLDRQTLVGLQRWKKVITRQPAGAAFGGGCCRQRQTVLCDPI